MHDTDAAPGERVPALRTARSSRVRGGLVWVRVPVDDDAQERAHEEPEHRGDPGQVVRIKERAHRNLDSGWVRSHRSSTLSTTGGIHLVPEIEEGGIAWTSIKRRSPLLVGRSRGSVCG